MIKTVLIHCYRYKNAGIFYLLLSLIFVLSFASMVNGINEKSLFLDEASFALNVQNFPDGLFVRLGTIPPLYYFATFLVTQLFGINDWIFRFIPLLSAIGGLFCLTCFFLKIYSRGVSLSIILLLATCLFSIQVAGISIAHYAHPYATDFFYSSLLLVFAYHLFQYPSRKMWMGFLLISALAVASSFAAFFVVFSYLSISLAGDCVNRNMQSLKFKITTMLPLLAFTAILAVFFFFPLSGDQSGLSLWSMYYIPLLPVKEFLKSLYLNTMGLLGYLFKNNWHEHLALFLIMTGMARFIDKKKFLLIGLTCVPIVFAMFASLLHRWPYGGVRTMIFSLPFIITIIGSGLELVSESITNKHAKIAFYLALVITMLTPVYRFKIAFTKIQDSVHSIEAVKSLAAAALPEIDKGDLFLVYYGAKRQFLLYFPKEAIDRAVFQTWDNRKNIMLLKDFVDKNLINHKGRFWLIFSHIYEHEDELMLQKAAEMGHLVQTIRYPGCGAYLFEI